MTEASIVAIRKAIEGRLDGYTIPDLGFTFRTDLSAEATARDLLTETDRRTEPAIGTWAILIVRQIDRQPTSISGKRHRIDGLISARVYTLTRDIETPETNRSLLVAQGIARRYDTGAFSGSDHPRIYLVGSSTHEHGPEGKWYLTQVRAPFQYYDET